MTRRKRYSAEFKRETIRRANEEGVTDVLVAEELGINARQLRFVLFCLRKSNPKQKRTSCLSDQRHRLLHFFEVGECPGLVEESLRRAVAAWSVAYSGELNGFRKLLRVPAEVIVERHTDIPD